MVNKTELIMDGLAYTVMGVLVVFMILVIIMLAIKAMALFSGTGEKKKTTPAKVETSPAPVVAEPVKKQDDGEIIAVITAAIASILGENATGFRIRSYKRVSGREWNKAGRRETLDNRI